MKWLLTVGTAIVVAVGVLVAVVVFHHLRTIPHYTSTKPTITVPPPKPRPEDNSLPWPTYGADNFRTRAVSAPGLRPPFRRLWTYFGRHLLELPPVAGYGLLYEESFDGRIHAIDPKDGSVKWSYYARRCGWSSPALGGGLVFATFIGGVSEHCAKLPGGEIVALDARTGKIRWSRNIGQSESSPLLARGVVYFGSTDGNLYAYAAKTGTRLWAFQSGGAVKGSPALAHGRLFFGNYAGRFFAIDARTGKQIWEKGGFGKFYGGPTVDGGRVYEGSIDGHVYAFSARYGDKLWSFGTGYYVYASTAVWRGIVFVGSYNHRFYAINGATGSQRWAFDAGGAISGAASVIDGLVYFSTLNHKTYALNAGGGRVRETWPDGEYSPAIAAYGRFFLIGQGRMYALEPRDSGSRRQHKR